MKPPIDPEALRREALARAAAGELLGPGEMQAIWRIGHSRWGVLLNRGAFDPFKVKPPIGSKCFSGVLVHRYLQGDPVYDATFGRKRLAR